VLVALGGEEILGWVGGVAGTLAGEAALLGALFGVEGFLKNENKLCCWPFEVPGEGFDISVTQCYVSRIFKAVTRYLIF
jgi:hypothetical protein